MEFRALRSVPIECARRNWRKNWRKTTRQKSGATGPLAIAPKVWRNRLFSGTMDWHNVSVQQARVASFFSQLLSITAEFAALEEDIQPREKSKFQQRLHWDQFVRNYKDMPLFRRHLRMSYKSFCTLLYLLNDHIATTDDKMASLRGGQIILELHLYATICYLAGGSYSDICIFCGISVTSFYCIVWRTIHAINKAIKIKFPSTVNDCANSASSFERISHRGVIKNCVGVLDGYLLLIITPRKSEAKNVCSFFSGHYQKYGMNIQACCNAQCRFTFLGIGGPGVTKDRTAIKESGLYDKVENLPPGYVCIGDCAYQPTENLVPIFGGDLALRKDNDNFNFFALQLQIRIEMAFGLMTRKWGILQHPLTNSLLSIKHIICCIARLHNFCIDERLKYDTSNFNTQDLLSLTQLAYMHACAIAEHQKIMSDEYPQWSLAREELVTIIKQQQLERPGVNRQKRKRMTEASAQESPASQDAGPRK